MGIRFKSEILTAVKYEDAEFVIDEYGFVVSRKDFLGEDELTLDTEVKAVGVGYDRYADVDIVFAEDDNCHVFTGVVKNIPTKQYKTDLVCKSYTKISVNGEQFVLYGEAVTGNVYDTAKALLESDPSNADLLKIIMDYEGKIGVPGDDLYEKKRITTQKRRDFSRRFLLFLLRVLNFYDIIRLTNLNLMVFIYENKKGYCVAL